MRSDTDLYQRGGATLLASWEAYARGAIGASVHRHVGVGAAVFPDEPERSVYNNALLDRHLPARERTDALDAMEAVYAAVGVDRFAAWVHESDRAMRSDLDRRGYMLDTSTRAMGLSLEGILPPRPGIDLAPPDWEEHLRIVGVPTGFLAAADPTAYHVLLARLDGETVATAIAFDLDGDCGIYNVGTLEHARRRGLANALTAIQLHDARARGCETASLQATPVAERLYATAGFRDLGRILEYVPPSGRRPAPSWGSAMRHRQTCPLVEFADSTCLPAGSASRPRASFERCRIRRGGRERGRPDASGMRRMAPGLDAF